MCSTGLPERIDLDGDTWRILGVGTCHDGYCVCHLASTTRFRTQRNGRVPVQAQADVPMERVEGAMQRPRGFFQWNRALRGAFEKGEAAARDGGVETDCPYADDKRAHRGQITWSRSFRAAWCDGFRREVSRRATATPSFNRKAQG